MSIRKEKKLIAMIRQETYQALADTFGTGLGVAEWEGNFYPHYTNIAKMPDEMKVIALTNFVIREEVYQQVIREVLRLETKYKNKRIKQSTIYEKSINNIIKESQLV
jgi:hypothetical protein